MRNISRYDNCSGSCETEASSRRASPKVQQGVLLQLATCAALRLLELVRRDACKAAEQSREVAL